MGKGEGMTTLAEQLDQIMQDHKDKTAREYEKIERLNAALKYTDEQMLAHIQGVLDAHVSRRDGVLELVGELHHMIMGTRPYDQLPPIEDRYAFNIPSEAKAKQVAGSIWDQIEGFQGRRTELRSGVTSEGAQT